MITRRVVLFTAAVTILALLALPGCSSTINAFKELGVSGRNIPSYEVSSEISDKNPPEKIWATVNLKDIDENQAKQIQADYINKKIKEDNIRSIQIIVNVGKNQYTAQYVKDADILKTTGGETPQKYPAIIYQSNS